MKRVCVSHRWSVEVEGLYNGKGKKKKKVRIKKVKEKKEKEGIKKVRDCEGEG